MLISETNSHLTPLSFYAGNIGSHSCNGDEGDKFTCADAEGELNLMMNNVNILKTNLPLKPFLCLCR